MTLHRAWSDARGRWRLLTIYQRFEHAVIGLLTFLIAVVIVSAVWNLTVKILFSLVLTGGFDPTDHAVFQAVFGMIFTVIIALEFKRSLLVVAERRSSVVQVRTVALGSAILALGAVHWLVREQDRRERGAGATRQEG
jgi:uncharacterized membrane protein (DUF373 family)